MQRQDLAALGHGLFNFLVQGGHIIDPAAIHTGNALCAQTARRAGGVHRNIAAADNAHALSGEIGHVPIANAAQQMHGADHIFAVLALNAQLFVGVCANGNVHSIVLLLNAGNFDIRTHRNIGVYFDAGRKDMLNIAVQHVLGQAIIRNAVAQHTAQLGALLIHRYLMAH